MNGLGEGRGSACGGGVGGGRGKVPRTGRKWGKPGRSRRRAPSLKVCLACPAGSLSSTTTRSSGS
ncbi:methyl-CpG-binding protein [Streptomyces albofaciens JCM 4342]|nr:methyl-CpG-binding protein [Streptomyces albofaciens JCM 4342]